MHYSPDHILITPFIKINIFNKYSVYTKVKLSVLMIFMLSGSFCNPHNPETILMDKYLFAYDLGNPEANYKLPSYLEEISGISYYGKGKIACVQDEKANIYILSLEHEKIIKKYDFGKDADYETLTIVGKTAYI